MLWTSGYALGFHSIVPWKVPCAQRLMITEMITRFKLITPAASECWHLCFLSRYKVDELMNNLVPPCFAVSWCDTCSEAQSQVKHPRVLAHHGLSVVHTREHAHVHVVVWWLGHPIWLPPHGRLRCPHIQGMDHLKFMIRIVRNLSPHVNSSRCEGKNSIRLLKSGSQPVTYDKCSKARRSWHDFDL